MMDLSSQVLWTFSDYCILCLGYVLQFNFICLPNLFPAQACEHGEIPPGMFHKIFLSLYLLTYNHEYIGGENSTQEWPVKHEFHNALCVVESIHVVMPAPVVNAALSPYLLCQP